MKPAVVTGENVTSDWELIPHTGYSRGWQGMWQLFLRPLKQEVSLTFPSCFLDNYSRQSLDCHCCSSRNAWLCNTRLNSGKEEGKDKKHPLSQCIHQQTAVCRERGQAEHLICTLVPNSTFFTINQEAIMSTLNPEGISGDRHLEHLKVH